LKAVDTQTLPVKLRASRIKWLLMLLLSSGFVLAGGAGAGGAAGAAGGAAGTAGAAGGIACGPMFSCTEHEATRAGLTWKRATESGMMWPDAKLFCATKYGPTWRLPTRDELHTLVDMEAKPPPFIDKVTFPGTLSAYWTGDINDVQSSYYIDFSLGGVAQYQWNYYQLAVRCVEGS